jgi:hypothetical protein
MRRTVIEKLAERESSGPPKQGGAGDGLLATKPYKKSCFEGKKEEKKMLS